jgi:hypothetical protein
MADSTAIDYGRAMPIRLAGFAMLFVSLVVTPTALAGGPGKWTQLGANNIANIDQAALARTPDGVLHAVWTVAAGDSASLVHDAISPNGNAAAPNVVTSGWAGIENTPDLVATPSGLQVFFGGQRSTNGDETNTNMNTATAPASGGSWDLHIGNVVSGGSASAADTGVALLPDGTPLESWGGTTDGVFTHRGLDPATADFAIQSQLGGCCGYSPDIAVDKKTGAPFVVWISNATDNVGVFAQSLDPNTGAPSGPVAHMPGSSTLSGGSQQSNQQLFRVPVAARAGGGVYVAYPGDYPTTKKVFLWRIADSKSSVLGFSQHDHLAGVAADPGGRLWVLWAERGARNLIFARRSNKKATKFGPAVKVGVPKAQQTVFDLEGDAQLGPLDVVALMGDSAGKQAQWHTQLLPGLDLHATPAKINGGKSTAVKFTVSDPDPVKGAKVTAAGKSATTDAKGHATIDLGPTSKKRFAATAKKAGYTSGDTTVKVK